MIQWLRLHASRAGSMALIPAGSDSKESTCSVGDPGLIPGWGRSPGGGNVDPLQYSYLETPTDRGAWRARRHGVAESQTRLSTHRSHTGTEILWVPHGRAPQNHSVSIKELIYY